MKAGDEILVPANTYIASILSITENKLVPVLVEPDINTYNIDPKLIAEKITPKTKAILIVHLYGRIAYNTELQEIATKYNLKVVEDSAQALVLVGKTIGLALWAMLVVWYVSVKNWVPWVTLVW